MMLAFYVENTFYIENTFCETCVTERGMMPALGGISPDGFWVTSPSIVCVLPVLITC
jgi:hypothetical protein